MTINDLNNSINYYNTGAYYSYTTCNSCGGTGRILVKIMDRCPHDCDKCNKKLAQFEERKCYNCNGTGHTSYNHWNYPTVTWCNGIQSTLTTSTQAVN